MNATGLFGHGRARRFLVIVSDRVACGLGSSLWRQGNNAPLSLVMRQNHAQGPLIGQCLHCRKAFGAFDAAVEISRAPQRSVQVKRSPQT